jgi:hypothetical protein
VGSGERPRSRTGYRASTTSPRTYGEWVDRFEHQDDSGRTEVGRQFAANSHSQTFSIVIPVYDAEDSRPRAATDSVLAQVYPGCELCVADDASTSLSAHPILGEAGAGTRASGPPTGAAAEGSGEPATPR